MTANVFNRAESLPILMEMATLGIPMDSLACEAVERGYTGEETRDQGNVGEYDRYRPIWALDGNFDVAKRLYLIHCFARNQRVAFNCLSVEIKAR
jgi:hypothetical protein